MAEAKFAVGDVVMAKAGGPPMTVTDVVKGSARFGYRTSWSADGGTQHGTFPEDQLQHAGPGPG